jgi:hypothetical protein
MRVSENFASTLPLSIQFIPLGTGESRCGNCANWKGPRERNGRKNFICLDNSKGICRQKAGTTSATSISGALTSPVCGNGCPHWTFAA